MNEILRAKRLTEEILGRAAAIKASMDDVNQRMANMQQIEQQSKAKAAAAGKPAEAALPQLQLLDLPDDVLSHIATSLGEEGGLLHPQPFGEAGGGEGGCCSTTPRTMQGGVVPHPRG